MESRERGHQCPTLHCNPVPIPSVCSSATGIVFTVSVCQQICFQLDGVTTNMMQPGNFRGETYSGENFHRVFCHKCSGDNSEG